MNQLKSLLDSYGCALQVALDFTRMGDALAIASRLQDLEGPIVLEAGTPLLKAEGARSIELLRAVPPGRPVVADTKTMDAGAIEAGLAGEYGASALSVLAVAPEETISETVREAHRLGLLVYGDLIAVDDPLEAIGKLDRAGVDIVLLHVGIDVQRKLGVTAGQMAELVREIRGKWPRILAVAGGIKPGEVKGMVDAGADIVIIGGAITKSRDPAGAARAALEGLESCSR